CRTTKRSHRAYLVSRRHVSERRAQSPQHGRSIRRSDDRLRAPGEQSKMITIVLLAGSFVRQNRWLLPAFAAWPFLLAGFFWSPHHHADRRGVTDVLQHEVFFGIGVTAFLASSALHN